MEAVARRRAELKQEEASKADATVSTPRDSPSRSATWQMKPASHHLLTVALGCKAVLLFFEEPKRESRRLEEDEENKDKVDLSDPP